MADAVGPDAPLDITLPPEAQCIPVARHSVVRWMLRRDLAEGHALVEFVTSELLAQGITHAIDRVDLHVEETDGGHVRVEVRGSMTSEPQRFSSVADAARRRREALLAALCVGHDEVWAKGRVTLWAEVRADRDGF